MATVSILMSTYNTPARWLIQCMDSLLNQTFSDFELLLVDDCSEVPFSGIREQYTDPRIRWIQNEKNLGLTKSLNKLLKMATGRYIARMDADDVCLPERLAVQVQFLEEQPNVIVCGSYRRAFGLEEKDEIWNLPATREEQQVQLFFYNCGLTHPTAMFRKTMLDEFGITYNEVYKKAQDYGIWVQCARYAPMAMIPKVLLKYRKSEQQISTAGRQNQLSYDAMIRLDQLACLDIVPTDEEKKMHIAFVRNEHYDDAVQLEAWVDRLLEGNQKTGYLVQPVFKRELRFRWYEFCRREYRGDSNLAYKQAYKRAFTWKLWMHEQKRNVKTFAAKLLGR